VQSALGCETANQPRDVDLLFIYDEEAVPPFEVYTHVRPLSLALQRLIGVPVHPTILSKKGGAHRAVRMAYGCSFIASMGRIAARSVTSG
jgi:hypothetical protein